MPTPLEEITEATDASSPTSSVHLRSEEKSEGERGQQRERDSNSNEQGGGDLLQYEPNHLPRMVRHRHQVRGHCLFLGGGLVLLLLPLGARLGPGQHLRSEEKSDGERGQKRERQQEGGDLPAN